MVKIRIESNTEITINEKARAVIAFVFDPESMNNTEDDRTVTQVIMNGVGNHMKMLLEAATSLRSLVDTAIDDPIDRMMLRVLMMKGIEKSAAESVEVDVVNAEKNKIIPDTMKNEGRAPWDA